MLGSCVLLALLLHLLELRQDFLLLLVKQSKVSLLFIIFDERKVVHFLEARRTGMHAFPSYIPYIPYIPYPLKSMDV